MNINRFVRLGNKVRRGQTVKSFWRDAADESWSVSFPWEEACGSTGEEFPLICASSKVIHGMALYS